MKIIKIISMLILSTLALTALSSCNAEAEQALQNENVMQTEMIDVEAYQTKEVFKGDLSSLKKGMSVGEVYELLGMFHADFHSSIYPFRPSWEITDSEGRYVTVVFKIDGIENQQEFYELIAGKYTDTNLPTYKQILAIQQRGGYVATRAYIEKNGETEVLF